MKSLLFIECFMCKNQIWKTHAISLSVAKMFTSLPDNKIHLIFDESAEGYCTICWKNNLEDKIDVFNDAERQNHVNKTENNENNTVDEYELLYMSFMTQNNLKQTSTDTLQSDASNIPDLNI